jgi:phosphonate transport system permease protein
MTPKNNIVIAIIVGLVIVASYNVDANPVDFAEGIPNLGVIMPFINFSNVDFPEPD